MAKLNTNWIILIKLFLLFLQKIETSQLGLLNTPPVMYIDRNWRINETEMVGSIVTRVHAQDTEDDKLEFGLEPLTNFDYNSNNNNNNIKKNLPFRIDKQTGVVYLNESLLGRSGENFFLYVTVSDGTLTAKNEVYVHIINQNTTKASNLYNTNPSSFTPNAGDIRRLLPSLHLIPGINTQTTNINNNNNNNINNNKNNNNNNNLNINRNQQDNYYSPYNNNFNRQILLNPNNNNNNNNNDNDYNLTDINKTENESLINNNNNNNKENLDGLSIVKNSTIHDNNSNNNTIININNYDKIKANTDTKAFITITIIIIIVFIICIIILIIVFRKYVCNLSKKISKKNKSKEDILRKIQSSTIGNHNIINTDIDDSRNSMVMQYWHGSTALSNRYVPAWQQQQQQQLQQGDGNQHTQITSQLSNNSSNKSIIKDDKLLKTDQWEFPRHRLKFFNILGEGAFGQVWRCEANDIDGFDGISTVAVKTLKENATEAEKNDLMSELQVLKTLEHHPNVVRLLGCCTEKDPIFVIIEYVNRGKLQTYLRNSRAERHYGNMHGKSKTLTSGDLTSFMYQVARGMDFLSSRGIIHRDLAARNILIQDDHVCKVADFGFARDIVSSKIYERKSEGKLPIRWMAIESLYDNLFSVKSDIWSFGILMWEIVTLGSTPYPGTAAAEVMKKVRNGFRLEKPEHCRRELYNIMYYCWAEDPDERPAFTELVQLLDKLLLTETDYIELERFPDHNYYNMLSLSGEKV